MDEKKRHPFGCRCRFRGVNEASQSRQSRCDVCKNPTLRRTVGRGRDTAHCPRLCGRSRRTQLRPTSVQVDGRQQRPSSPQSRTCQPVHEKSSFPSPKKKARCDIPDGEMSPPGRLKSYRRESEFFRQQPPIARPVATDALPALRPLLLECVRPTHLRSQYRVSSVGE